MLSAGRLHWRVPMQHCVAGFSVLFVACALWLEEAPPPPPGLPGGAEGKARLGELQRLEASTAEKKLTRSTLPAPSPPFSPRHPAPALA